MSLEEEKIEIKKHEINKLNNSINKKESLIINEDSINNSKSSCSSNSLKEYLEKKRFRKIFSPKINKIKENSYKNIVSLNGNIIFKSNGKDKCIVDFFKPKNLINNFKNEENNLKEKNKEIEELKNEIEIYQEKIISIEEKYKEQINKVNMNLCSVLKELESLKRNMKKKELNEMELKIGKSSLMRTTRGEFIDYWEDGNEVINIKDKIKIIEEEKKEILDKQNFNNNLTEQNTISLKLSLLSREEKSLNSKLNNFLLFHYSNLN